MKFFITALHSSIFEKFKSMNSVVRELVGNDIKYAYELQVQPTMIDRHKLKNYQALGQAKLAELFVV